MYLKLMYKIIKKKNSLQLFIKLFLFLFGNKDNIQLSYLQ